MKAERMPKSQQNVFGEPIELCCEDPLTGFTETVTATLAPMIWDPHCVCLMTEEFLEFSASVGNDLSTPRPEFGFPGLVEGNKWCLCALRWEQAHQAGKAPKLFLRSTNIVTLRAIPLEVLSPTPWT